MLKHRHANQPKLTKGCKRVLEVLQKTADLTSAQDIHGVLRKKESLPPGLTTVYRSLDSLVDLGLVQSVDLGDGEKRYELITPGEHHHHLVCRQCQKSIHLDECVVIDLEKSLKTKYGFEMESHILEVFGNCRDCIKTANKGKHVG